MRAGHAEDDRPGPLEPGDRSGERLVVFAENEGPPPDWYANAFESMQETPFLILEFVPAWITGVDRARANPVGHTDRGGPAAHRTAASPVHARSTPPAQAAPAPPPEAPTPALEKPPEPPPSYLTPDQERRLGGYSGAGQPLLTERLQATRERLDRAPDERYAVELFVTSNTSPPRMERFLMRARDMVPLEELLVIPMAGGGAYRLRVVYGS